MKSDVTRSKIIRDTFYEESGLNDRAMKEDMRAIFLIDLLEERAMGMKQTQQAMKHHCDKSTINRAINELKDLYDLTQLHSKTLPVRPKKSKTDEDLDK